MTSKHYIMLAALIRECIDKGYSFEEFAVMLSRKLKKDNPRFDENRFLEACIVP
jgi:hypothetical protein